MKMGEETIRLCKCDAFQNMVKDGSIDKYTFPNGTNSYSLPGLVGWFVIYCPQCGDEDCEELSEGVCNFCCTENQNNLDQLNSALNTYLNVKTLSFSEIKNEGKTLWVSIIFIFFLQAFKAELISLYEKVNLEQLIFELIRGLPI